MAAVEHLQEVLELRAGLAVRKWCSAMSDARTTDGVIAVRFVGLARPPCGGTAPTLVVGGGGAALSLVVGNVGSAAAASAAIIRASAAAAAAEKLARAGSARWRRATTHTAATLGEARLGFDLNGCMCLVYTCVCANS